MRQDYKYYETICENIVSEKSCNFDINIKVGNTIDTFWIKEYSSKVIGAAYIYHDNNDEIFVSSINVDIKYRERGFGNTILRMIEKLGWQIGANYALLTTVYKSWMYYWYKRHGYRDIGKNHDCNSDMVWMRKKLG